MKDDQCNYVIEVSIYVREVSKMKYEDCIYVREV